MRHPHSNPHARPPRAQVGAVETGLVYSLTCPTGKKYIGTTGRTLTQRQATAPQTGTGLVREAIAKFGGVTAFRTEVLVCCSAASLEANEKLYIERLGTVHPKGYNEDMESEKMKIMKRANRQARA